MTKLLPCFVCGKEFESALPKNYEESQNGFHHAPSKGTTFYTYGHYGSTFWDSFDGEQLVICICDDCLHSKQERLTYIRKIREHPDIWVEFNHEDKE